MHTTFLISRNGGKFSLISPTGEVIEAAGTMLERLADQLREDHLEDLVLSPGKSEKPNVTKDPKFATVTKLLQPFLGENKRIPLFPFQDFGVDWLLKTKRGILADDMGLGKTVQAIAATRQLISVGAITRALVIAPRSLIFNWQAEYQKWAPELTANVLVAGARFEGDAWNRNLESSHIVITSYEQIREGFRHVDGRVDLLIADEAHRLRNSDSLQSRGVSSINVERLWLLTGTPIERDLDDFLTLMSLVNPTKFGLKNFNQDPELLKLRAKPFLLRRHKEDVLNELPPVTAIHELLELEPAQRKAYDACRRDRSIRPAIKKFGLLRSLCDFEPESGESAKIARISEILADIRANDENAVVFSYWNEPLDLLFTRLSESLDCEIHLYISRQSLKQRNESLQAFRDRGGVLLAAAHIASEGLTLNEANHALFMNRWWNPSLNNQASDRIRRIGQTKATFTYTFTSKDTIEEAIDSMLDFKTETEQQFVAALAKVVDL